MKGTMKKLLAGLLLSAIVMSDCSAGMAYAVEAGKAEASVAAQTENASDTSDAKKTDVSEKTDAAEPAAEEAGVMEQSLEENETPAYQSENRLNYMYVESPYLETPETQNIVVSWGDGTEAISNMRITVEKEDGSTEEWQCSRQAEQLYLFSKDYAGNEQSTYKVVDIKFVEQDTEQTFALADLEAEAQFGVNKEYDGIDELKPVDEGESVEASVVTIEENGETKAQADIAQALDSATAEVGMSRARTMALAPVESRAGEIVVALDPGHDNIHGGTTGFGLAEKDLTLKIANYAKTELETYNGVKVYMTRTGAACPFPNSGDSGTDITQRVKAAAQAGAKIFVSFHLNSSTSASANGAEVLIPNTSWKPDHNLVGSSLGTQIRNELVALGLTQRRVYSVDGNGKYEDGSTRDNFAVHSAGKTYGVPGIIIEHAFMSNAGDVNNFLKTEAGLKKLGVADATGIAKYLGLSQGSWNGDSYYVKGQPLKNQGYKIDGYWYYFDANGKVQKNWWRTKGADKFYYNADGRLVVNQGYQVGGKWYYFGVSGAMQKNWWRTKGADRFYYDGNGQLMVNVGSKISGAWYYFGSSGAMYKNQFRDKGSDRFYYDENGHLVVNKGYKAADGKWYYFKTSGAMYKNWWRTKGADQFYYNDNGQLVVNQEFKAGSYWYYFGISGAVQKNVWRSAGGNRFYYNENGYRLENVGCKLGGYWYYFGSDGVMYKDRWRDKGNDKFYYDGNGHLVVNQGQKIEAYWYFFGTSGAMMKNWWRNKGGQLFYYDKDGHLVSNTVLTISGKTYFFTSSGAAIEMAGSEYLIAGQTAVGADKLVRYYKANASIDYPKEAMTRGGADTLEKFCQMYIDECKIEGIRAEVAFTQAMLETGFLKFGKDVKIEQYNFAGLGAVGGGAAGASFPDVRTGIRAQVQHLKCYANREPLKQDCVDPRWSNNLRAKAPYIMWLSIPLNPYGTGWAADGKYADKLITGINKLIKG